MKDFFIFQKRIKIEEFQFNLKIPFKGLCKYFLISTKRLELRQNPNLLALFIKECVFVKEKEGKPKFY